MHTLGKCGCADDNWDNKVRALSCHFAFNGYYPLNLGDPNTPDVATWTGPPVRIFLMTVWSTVYEIELWHLHPITFERVTDGSWTMTVTIAYTRNKYTGEETLYVTGTEITGRPDHAYWNDEYLDYASNHSTPLTDSRTETERTSTWTAEWQDRGANWTINATAHQYLSLDYTRTEYESLFNALLARVTHARIREKYNETEWAEAGTVGYNADGTIGERWLVHDETITIGGVEQPNDSWIQTITIHLGSDPTVDDYNYFVSQVEGSAWSYDDDNVLAGFDNTMLNQNGFADSVGISQSYFGWGCARYTQYQVCDPTRYCAFPGFESYCTLTIWPVDPETETDVIVQFIARPINFCPQWNQTQLPPNCCTTDAVGTSRSLELGGAGYWQEWKRSELGGCSACP